MTCTVTETLNGEWELTLTHPIDDAGKWTRLAEGNILRAPVPAAMTPRVDLVTQQYQTTTYDVQIYKITTKSGPLRLRSGTGTKYKILGKYKKGKEVNTPCDITSSRLDFSVWKRMKNLAKKPQTLDIRGFSGLS